MSQAHDQTKLELVLVEMLNQKRASLLGARTLLVAPGIATSSVFCERQAAELGHRPWEEAGRPGCHRALNTSETANCTKRSYSVTVTVLMLAVRSKIVVFALIELS